MVEQDGELLGRQGVKWRLMRDRPPGYFSLRVSLQAEPITSTIEDQQLEGRARLVTENKQRARHRVLRETLLADSRQSINALPEIDGFYGKQDFELRDELDHRLGTQE